MQFNTSGAARFSDKMASTFHFYRALQERLMKSTFIELEMGESGDKKDNEVGNSGLARPGKERVARSKRRRRHLFIFFIFYLFIFYLSIFLSFYLSIAIMPRGGDAIVLLL